MEGKACCDSEAGQGVAEPGQPAAVESKDYRRYLLPGILLLSGWWLLYRGLAPFSRWKTYDIFSLTRGSHFASAVEFFIFDTPKVLLLLTLVVFGVGIARSYFTTDRARRILAGRREAVGNVFAALLGILFALSFCPVSAALFFGSLIPLSVSGNSPVFYPLLFGFGTGIPVIVFAVMIAFGMRSIEAIFRGVTRVELWVRRITGAVFVVAGLYDSAIYIFEAV